MAYTKTQQKVIDAARSGPIVWSRYGMRFEDSIGRKLPEAATRKLIDAGVLVRTSKVGLDPQYTLVP